MAKYRIYNVTLSKKTVGPGERLVVQVDIITWDWIKKNLTWGSLKERFKWGDLIGSQYSCKDYSTAGYRYERSW